MTPGNEMEMPTHFGAIGPSAVAVTFNRTLTQEEVARVTPLVAQIHEAVGDAARPSQPPVDVERVARVKAAVADARLCLARLADYAVVHCVGLTDQSPVIADALKAIAAIDGVFTSSTDAATGLPIAAMQP